MGSLSYALLKYFLARDHIISGNVHLWAKPTILWPTIMLLSISTITFLADSITFCTYTCGEGAANKATSVFGWAGYIMQGAHVVAWAVATRLFQVASTDHSLWGCSCSNEVNTIQEQVQSFMSLGQLCTLQVSSHYLQCQLTACSVHELMFHIDRIMGLVYPPNHHSRRHINCYSSGVQEVHSEEEDGEGEREHVHGGRV
jgi:hypothetical protein